MRNRISLWVAMFAAVVGLASVTITTIITNNQAHSARVTQCTEETRQNQQIRDYIAGLVADPKTPPAVRQKAVAGALKSFPLVPVICLP